MAMGNKQGAQKIHQKCIQRLVNPKSYSLWEDKTFLYKIKQVAKGLHANTFDVACYEWLTFLKAMH
eukprot:285708-Amphidinium_carterae.3